jgi:hypothetical protein
MYFHAGTPDNPVGSPFVQRVKAAASTNATSIKRAPALLPVSFSPLLPPPQPRPSSSFMTRQALPWLGPTCQLRPFRLSRPTTYAGLVEVVLPAGLRFNLGIAFAITGAVGDADATAVAADAVHGFILWK